jgi:hypothetical protein
MLKKLSPDSLLMIAVIVVGVFIFLLIGDSMSENVAVVEDHRATTVMIRLERDYHVAPRSKILKDAVRELNKEIAEQLSRER